MFVVLLIFVVVVLMFFNNVMTVLNTIHRQESILAQNVYRKNSPVSKYLPVTNVSIFTSITADNTELLNLLWLRMSANLFAAWLMMLVPISLRSICGKSSAKCLPSLALEIPYWKNPG